MNFERSLPNGRGSWVVGTSRGSWVWVWVKVDPRPTTIRQTPLKEYEFSLDVLKFTAFAVLVARGGSNY